MKKYPEIDKAVLAPYKSRAAVLESIAVASAQASTAKSSQEYLLWASREGELRRKVQPVTPAEEAKIADTTLAKIRTYTEEMGPQRSYPEINAWNLRQVKAALAVGKAKLASVAPEKLDEHFDKLAALEERRDRLVKTARHISKTQGRGL